MKYLCVLVVLFLCGCTTEQSKTYTHHEYVIEGCKQWIKGFKKAKEIYGQKTILIDNIMKNLNRNLDLRDDAVRKDVLQCVQKNGLEECVDRHNSLIDRQYMKREHSNNIMNSINRIK